MSEQTPAADFAALLRELKDRSGLSYGVLAKRLHMSTSTLHRYCNGDAVPADYAPVERLARLCRARPEELVELHRRWVLADAARGRKGTAPAATPPAKESADTGPGEAASADVPPPETPSVTPLGPMVSSPVEEADETREDDPADVGPTGDSAPARRRTRRTRTAVLVGIAVAAVAAGVTFAVGLPDGGGSGDDGEGGRHRPVGAAGVTAEESASASSSPSSSPSSSSSASPSPSAKDEDAAQAGTAPAGAPDDEGRNSGVPVTVRTDPYAWESPCSQRYLVDKPAGGMRPPPLEEGAAAWVAAHGAVSSGQQYLKLTVQGTGPETVVVDGLTVRVAGKRAPLAWNDYAMAYPGVGCGGGVPTRAFSVSLDSARPSLAPEPGNDDFPFKVSESDPEVYYLTASVSAYDVDWYLELKWSSGDRSGTLTVDDKGRPFRTSGNKGRPAYEFPIGGDGWVPEGTTKLD